MQITKEQNFPLIFSGKVAFHIVAVATLQLLWCSQLELVFYESADVTADTGTGKA